MNLEGEQEVITLSEICRVCLVKNGNMKHLLEPNEEIIQIITKLSSVSNVEIEINDTLPCFLCSSCEEKLKVSYDFQQLCLKSHQFLLACISASSVSFKVNSFKPLNFEDVPEKSADQPQQLDNNSETFISFVDNDGLEKKALVSYYSIPDIPDLTGNDTDVILKETQENVSDNCLPVIDDLRCKNDNANISKSDIDENYEKPAEVEKRTKHNQIMRLPQFSPEDVHRIIKKTKERFLQHVNCLHCGFMAKDSRALSVHMTRLHKKMKEHWCLWCNENFENIKEHSKTVHKDDFKCPLCGKHKINTGHFMEHLASHSIQRNHVCGQCGKCFISERHLRMHMRVHTKRKPFRCQVCLKVFLLERSLNNHFKIHNKHRCKVCDQPFSSSEEYNAHKCFSNKETKHDSDTTPQNYCTVCNKRVRSLQNHLDSVHSDPDKNKVNEELKALCSYCGKRFKSPAKLTIHLRIHTGEMPYKCQYCGKRMSTRVHLVVHERTHTGEKPHVCKFCGKSFAQSSVLNTHMKQHTGKPEECLTCHKRFCRPSELRQHMRTHTGEKPYRCGICGQAFTQRSHLVGHSKRHTNERPYKCDYCEKCFKQGSSLRSHMDIHLGRKPYKCSLCTYACRQSHSLKQHMLQHDSEPKREWYKCDLCGQCFTSLEMYTLHYSNDHVPLKADDIKEDLIVTSTVEVMQHLQEFT